MSRLMIWITRLLFLTPLLLNLGNHTAYAQEAETKIEQSLYIHPDNGISFRFPADWKYDEFSWENSDPIKFDYLSRFYTPDNEIVSLLIWKNVIQGSSEEWISNIIKTTAGEAEPTFETAMFSGTLTYWYVSKGDFQYPTSLYIHFVNGDYGYRIHYVASVTGGALEDVFNIVASMTWDRTKLTNFVESSQLHGMEQIAFFVDSQFYPHTHSDVQSVRTDTTIIDPTYNRYSYGQCTWWAAYSRPDIPMDYDEWPKDAHGGYWDDRAREHPDFEVVGTPTVGALAVWEPDASNSYGHVAYVTNVHEDGSFDVTEMNYGRCWGTTNVCARTRLSADGVSFIPGSVTIFEDRNFGGDWQRHRASISSLQFGNGVSSIYIPPKWDIIAYEDANYQGSWFERLGGADLSTSLQDLTRHSFQNGQNINDHIKSLKIGYQICLAPLNRQFSTTTASCQSSSEPVPLPPALPPTTQPTEPSCATSQTGVILYEDREYKGRCVPLLNGKYNLVNFNLNDDVSSMRINGNYTVKLYEDANQSGRSDEINKSEPNLDNRSLGGKWSSIKIENNSKESDCGNGQNEGVYFYKEKNYKGTCFYTTGDIKDFAYTKLGNNSASSVRIIGDWEVKVYDSQQFDGKSYSFTSSKDNLDDKPDIGEDISSARVHRKEKPEAPIAVCPAPKLLKPQNGAVLGQTTLIFSWSGTSCNRTDITESYRLRIKTTPNMSNGSDIVLDKLVLGATHELLIDSRWERQTLYWSVQVANPENGAAWANAYQFTVDTNLPPTVAIQQANAQPVTADEQYIWGNVSSWNIGGIATDSDGTVARVDVTCAGQSCAATNGAGLNGDRWSYQQEALEGRNHINVQATDNLGAVSQSGNVANLTLWVDQQPPQTGLVLNNSANPSDWPQWFTEPVVVHLAASDEGSGSGANLARAGVQEIRYQFNGGEWQSQSGNQLYLELNSSGLHTLRYYGVDTVGNVEAERSRQIAIDLTPPPAIGAATEQGGATNDQWQGTHEVPLFTWPAVADEHSGLWGYQLYFGEDAAGEGYHTVAADTLRQWQPQSTGVTTGVYYLRGRARDLAGNWSEWGTLFTFRFDNTPPANPERADHAAGVKSTVWQRTTSNADFTWPAAVDAGSGLQGYALYWGSDANGESNSVVTTNSYQQAAPLCSTVQTCTGYLRLQARDQVGNVAPSWSTAFVLRYDDTPPTLDFNINGGATTANSTQVTLFINGQDSGSGPAQMRFSEDGITWVTNWITYTTTQLWVINGISGQTTTVHLQIRDGVGLESPVISRSILFDSNIPAPQSANFTLFNSTFAAGSGEQNSANYWLHSTVAEPPDSAPLVSSNYLLLDGYEAGGVAPPAPTPTPTPPAQPTCNAAPILINDGVDYTGSRQVALRFCANGATEMQVSDNAGFNDAQWEPYAATKSITLAAPVAPVAPLYAYVRFRFADGTVQGAFADAIYFDATQPVPPQIYIGDPVAGIPSTMTIRSAAANAGGSTAVLIGPNDLVGGVTYRDNQSDAMPVQAAGVENGPVIDVYIENQDDMAGIGAVQLSENADFASAEWQAIPNNNVVNWALSANDGEKTLYARVQDKAGNISNADSADFTLDLTSPLGGIEVNPYVVGVNTDAVTIYLTAYDNQTGVTDMRISTDPLLLYGDVWRPYTTSLTIPAYLPLAGELSLYVQFRDHVGNASAVYSDTYQVDVDAPQVSVEVDPGETLTRLLHIYGYDNLSELATMRLSNDLARLAEVDPIAYTTDLSWVFDDRRVVWVQVEDSLGNRTDPIAIYAAEEVVMNSAIYLPLIQR